MVTVKHVKFTYSLPSWFHFFYGGSNGEILALTNTCAHYVNINNFLGLVSSRGMYFIFTSFPVLCQLREIAGQAVIGTCTSILYSWYFLNMMWQKFLSKWMLVQWRCPITMENMTLNILHELKFNEIACNHTFVKQFPRYNFNAVQTGTKVKVAASFQVSPGSSESE